MQQKYKYSELWEKGEQPTAHIEETFWKRVLTPTYPWEKRDFCGSLAIDMPYSSKIKLLKNPQGYHVEVQTRLTACLNS